MHTQLGLGATPISMRHPLKLPTLSSTTLLLSEIRLPEEVGEPEFSVDLAQQLSLHAVICVLLCHPIVVAGPRGGKTLASGWRSLCLLREWAAWHQVDLTVQKIPVLAVRGRLVVSAAEADTALRVLLERRKHTLIDILVSCRDSNLWTDRLTDRQVGRIAGANEATVARRRRHG